MSTSNFTLNQKIENLQYQINNLIPPSGGYVPINLDTTINDIKTFTSLPKCTDIPTLNDQLVNKLYVDTVAGTPALSAVLTAGNNAGGLSIVNLNDLGVSTINGSAYPPVVPADPLSAVLIAGNTADNFITLTDGNITNNLKKDTIELGYVDVGVATANITALNTATTANVDVSFTDLVNNITSQTFIKSQQNQTETSVNVIDPTNNLQATKTHITIGGAILDTDTATNTNTLFNTTHTHTITPSSGNDSITYTGGGVQNYIQNNVSSTQLFNTIKYDNNVSQVETTHTVQVNDGTTNLTSGLTTSSYQTNFNGSSSSGGSSVGANYETLTGSILTNNGAINVNGGGSEVLISAVNVSGASSHFLRLETPLSGDGLIEHQALGGSRNLQVSSTGNFLVNSTNTNITSNAIKQTNNSVGGLTTPAIELTNTNTSATISTGIPSIQTYKSGRNAQAGGDIIAQQSYFGKDGAGTKTEFARLQVKTENVAVGNQDGTMSVFCAVNGVNSEVFNFNGGQNEVNCFRPFDMNGNKITASTGSLTIDTTGAPGLISVNALQSLSLTAGSGSSMTLNTSSTGQFILNNSGTGNITFTGTGFQSATAGGSAGTHLCIVLNGTPYKIALLNP